MLKNIYSKNNYLSSYSSWIIILQFMIFIVVNIFKNGNIVQNLDVYNATMTSQLQREHLLFLVHMIPHIMYDNICTNKYIVMK